MSIPLTGSGGLFPTLGKIGGVINVTNDFRSGTSAGDLPKETNDVVAEMDGEDNDLRETVTPLLATARAAEQSLAQVITESITVAQNHLIKRAHDDDRLPEPTLFEAIRELIEQMEGSSDTVEANTVTATITYSGDGTSGAVIGDGLLIVSTKDGRGRTLEYAFSEDIVFRVSDASTAGSEVFDGRGEQAVSPLARDWPQGSGSTVSVTSLSVESTDNLVTDGGFENWDLGAPLDWTIDTGASQVAEETTTKFDGTSALSFVGDGTTATQIYQDITGLAAWQQLAVSVRVRLDVSPAAGTLQIDLYDDDASAVINDEEGTANSLSIDLTSASTTEWDAETVTFRLPEPMPASVRLRIHLTAALSSGSKVFIDNLIVRQMVQTYDGGPYVDLHSGATDWSQEDVIVAAISNDEASDWQRLFDRMFGMRGLDLILPSDGSPTILDSLIG